jgi:uncharacterized membrane protein
MADNKSEAKDPEIVSSKADIEKNKLNAVLSYLGILIIVPLISEDAKKSAYAKFHINQGLVILIASVALGMVWAIPILGWIVGFFGGIVLLVLWLMGLISAIQGEMKRVPILGNIELIK